MSSGEFLELTLGDMLAELAQCRDEFVKEGCKPACPWDRLLEIGKRACFLSQCLIGEIAETRRRRDMPCDHAVALLEEFITAADEVLRRPEAPSSLGILRGYCTNMKGRAESLRLMAERSRYLDEEIFGLEEAHEAPIDRN